MKRMKNAVTINAALAGHTFWGYGRGESCWVMVEDHTHEDADLDHASWQFRVKDSTAGIKAVAIALGNGMPNLSTSDECAEEYHTLGVEFAEEGCKHFLRFHQPNLFFASASSGFRAIWGSDLNRRIQVAELDTWEEEGWSLDVYKLRPNLPNGGFLVQSGNSCAFVMAEKRGSTWTITLTMPITPDGKLVGSVYQANFHAARRWYARHAK